MSLLKSIPWHLFAILGVIGFLVLFSATPAVQTAVIVTLVIVLWATEALPLSFTAMLFFMLCAIGQVVTPQVFLSGMMSPALWLVISGSIIGIAIQHTGLGNRIARLFVPFMTTYQRALLGSGCIGLIFIFIMPSAMGRIMMLMPIVLSLTEQLGYKDNNHARNGIILSTSLITFIPAFAVLPANVPNNILLGMVHTILHDSPTYSDYFILHFPVLGTAKIVIIMLILRMLYKAPAPIVSDSKQLPITIQERILLGVLATVFVLWLTEHEHGIKTAWVAIIGAVLCLYPQWKLTPEKPLSKINNDTIFYIAAIVSVGAVVYHSGLTQLIADNALSLLPLNQQNNFQNFTVLSFATMLLSLFVTITSTPAMLTPMTHDIAMMTGWTNEAVYMSQVVGFSTVLLPYQAPPLILAMHMGKISLREVMKILIPLNIIIFVVLIPLNYLWWSVLGMF